MTAIILIITLLINKKLARRRVQKNTPKDQHGHQLQQPWGRPVVAQELVVGVGGSAESVVPVIHVEPSLPYSRLISYDS